jgi:2-methylcitrate dehydratase PrpD
MHSALGLALMQATGTSWQLVLEGKPAKIYTGFPNMAGALSALLSRQGVRADFEVFEGEAGIFASFYGGEYVRTLLDEGLGEEFYTLGARFKPWPMTGVAHPFIDAALDLASRKGMEVSAIERVHLRGGPRLRHHCEPIEERRKPPNSSAAGDSIFFGVAKALVNREINLASFTPEGLGQAEVLRLAERMDYSVEPQLGESGIVEITMAGGSHFASRVDTPRGHSSRPLTFAEIAQKFRDCARYADQPPTESAVERMMELVDRLEKVPDVSVIPAVIGERE